MGRPTRVVRQSLLERIQGVAHPTVTFLRPSVLVIFLGSFALTFCLSSAQLQKFTLCNRIWKRAVQ